MQQVDDGWNSRPWRIAAWFATAGLIALPITIQLISGNFGWSLADFVSVTIILLMSCGLFDIAARSASSASYLAGTSAALAAGFGSIVLNGAIGFVGSEDEPHNLLFLAVVCVAVIGAVLARGHAMALSIAMSAAGIAHIVVSIGLLINADGTSDGDPQMEVVGLTVFAAMWLASAWLFRKASR